MWNILTNRYISIRTICRTTEFFSMASSTSTLLLDTYYYLSRTHCSDNADAPLYSNHFLSLSGQELVAHITVNEGKNTEYLWKNKFLILYTFIIKPLRLVWSASLYKAKTQGKRTLGRIIKIIRGNDLVFQLSYQSKCVYSNQYLRVNTLVSTRTYFSKYVYLFQ